MGDSNLPRGKTSKGKCMKSKKKPLKASTNETSKTDDPNDVLLENFALELKWCIQQIECSMNAKNANPKKIDELKKCYKTLCSPNQPMIKKRALMRNYCGDYREKIEKEARNFKKSNTESPTIQASSNVPSSSVYIKSSSHHLRNQKDRANAKDSLDRIPQDTTVSDSQKEFKFNFDIKKL